MTRTALRLAAVLTFALCTSACSSLDDAFSSVMGDDAPASGSGGQQASTDQNGFPVDNTPAQTADNGGGSLSAGTGATPVPPPPTQTADAGTPPPPMSTPAQPVAAPTPDLASIPDKPSGTTTPDQQKDVADSLAADRARANYSSEALRGGTEAAAPPPGPAPAPDTQVADAGTPPSSAAPAQPVPAAPPPSDSSTPAPSSDAGTPPPAAPDAGAPSAAPAGPVASAPEPAAPATGSGPGPAPAAGSAVASAPMAPPPGAQPAVPANGVPGAQPMMTADAQLGFKPSTAPALDSSISQFVPQPIIQRYQQTAANAGIATGPVAPSNQIAAVSPRLRHGRAVGGPEQMSGSVVANLDVLNSPSPSVYANAAGMPPAAVVMFPGDGTRLSAAGREQVRAAVAEFQNRGGTGFIKVVGHSSSRTTNMPVEKHLVAIFEKSQQRANAVAAEIIREGVPASRVLVEAVGDSQPVYYESMPQGEEGNRRAEIFFQG